MTAGGTPHEDQADERVRGRPGQGAAVLHRRVGFREKGGLPDGTELQLERNDDPAAKAFQQAKFQQGQPAAMFFTDDVQRDYERAKASGGEFKMPPTKVTGSTIAQVNDTCGNLIQITQLDRYGG